MLALLDPSRQESPSTPRSAERSRRRPPAVEAASGSDPAPDLGRFPVLRRRVQEYDVLLVNAIMDGLNLVAKEAPIVNQRAGAVTLSENAGA